MKKTSLAPYLLLAFFIHAAFLIGAHKYLRLPAEVEPADLIPVEVAVLSEEPPLPQPRLSDVPILGVIPVAREREVAASKPMVSTLQMPPLYLSPVDPSPPDETPILEAEMPIALVQAKAHVTPAYAQTPKKIDSPLGRSRPAADFVSGGPPSPKEGDSEPSLNIDYVPTLGVIAVARVGEKTASEPMRSTLQMPPLHLSPADPSPPDETPSLEAEIPIALVQAKAHVTPAYAQTPKKIDSPLGRSRPAADFVSELPPIPTFESPFIPEQREMIMVVSGALPSERVARTETKTGPISIVRPPLRVALKKEPADYPELMAPDSEPAAVNLDILSSFPFPGSPKGAAYLFVVDTSGSVKGSPLEGIKKSAMEFIGLMGRNDRAGIMTFNDHVELVSAFTSEKLTLRRQINRLRTAGKKTVLFDALTEASNLISRESSKNRFVVLFSDGKDEGSRSTLDEIIEEARQSGISILSVGYSRVEKEYLTDLRRLARTTGGDFVYAPQFHDVLTLYRASVDAGAEESAVQTAGRAFLEVKSHPIGAQVFVDGGSKGKTPLHLELPFGKHQILLTLPDYHDWEAQIDLSKAGKTPIFVRLFPVEE